MVGNKLSNADCSLEIVESMGDLNLRLTLSFSHELLVRFSVVFLGVSVILSDHQELTIRFSIIQGVNKNRRS